MTHAEKILLAAFYVERESHFTFADLVVTAFTLFPDTFRLGRTSYPDSNKVAVYLCGKRGLVGRGYLERIGQNLFVVTAHGHDEIERLERLHAS